MPRIAAFPKCFINELCETRSMSIFEWIDLAATLEVDGLELYPGFLLSYERSYLKKVKQAISDHGLTVPMFCVSPNFTNPDPAARRQEIEKYRQILDVVAFFEGETCRVLSGQAYPAVSREDGIKWVVDCINEVLHDAAARGITLVMENHYKDNFWLYPEFALPSDIFVAIVNQINSPWFGVNYDPSNTIIAGEDPLALLRQVKERVVTMHASDRFLKSGTLADLKKQDGIKGYSELLSHGVIGQGLNDYDAIFSELKSVGFDGWISIEDGLNGMEELRQSVRFLREKIAQYFGE
ncbi:sugar phosphate isomerase/epimerase family protein [Moorella sp. Hama-1]|uniref:sugar phosphate isomerase/epimerase family protein n=1 Tax=Moorella sp. Hama-1 TaxID=2138101 RepID=UPI000D656427|nr:sugar phosphate isomerase/epimerase family protein [Moorella sp. Hama-1]BCV19944.1 myo-inositol catabolism protein IolH [Moorella sp. Hama-1]